MIIHEFIIKIFMLIAMVATALYATASSPIVKKGEGNVIVKVDAPDSIRQQFSPEFYYMPLFSKTLESVSVESSVNENGDISFKVPMELDHSLVILRIELARNTGLEAKAVGMLEISQGRPLSLSCKYREDDTFSFQTSVSGIFNDQWTDGRVGAKDNISLLLGDIKDRITFPPFALGKDRVNLTAAELENWRIMRQKYDSICDIQIACALNGRQIPDVAMPWFENNLKYFSFGRFPLMYRTFGKKYNYGDEITKAYPPEFFSFLSEVDFGDDFLKFIPIGYTPYYFFYQLLTCFSFNNEIPAIGNADPDEWRQSAKSFLSSLGMKLTAESIDLLLASSYMMQIQDNRPLSPVQRRNVEKAFTNDLGKIVLSASDELAEKLEAETTMVNLSSENKFSLRRYIKTNFPGRPVLVDVWATWCGPCHIARTNVERYLSKLSKRPVILYITDTTSGKDKWEKEAPLMGGTHLYLSQDAMAQLQKSYDFNTIPEFIFYNSNGEMTGTVNGIPTQEELEQMITAIMK